MVIAALVAAGPARADDGDSAQARENASARNPEVKTLSGLLEVAVRQSPRLADARFDAEAAEGRAIAAESVADWVVQGDAAGTRIESPTAAEVGQSFTETRFDAALSVSKNLAWGTRLRFDAAGGTSELEQVGGMGAVDIVTSAITGTIEQPLLRGAGEDAARGAVKQASLAAQIAAIDARLAATRVVAAIASGYRALALAERLQVIRARALELADRQLALAKQARRAGVGSRANESAAEQARFRRSEELLLAEVEVINRAVALRQLVGLEIAPGQIRMASTGLPKIEPRVLDLDKLLARALARNPGLRRAALVERSGALGLRIAEDRDSSVLDLRATVGTNGVADSAGGSLEQLTSGEAYVITGGLTYRAEIGNSAGRGAVREARALLGAAKVDAAATRREIAGLTITSVNNVRVARKRVEVTAKARELAATNVKLEELRFKASPDTTSFDVLARQDELIDAEIAEVQALVDYFQAVDDLDALTDDLLARHGIKLDK